MHDSDIVCLSITRCGCPETMTDHALWQSLPEEIVFMILDTVIALYCRPFDHFRRTYDPISLKNVCLVSRHWYKKCAQHLLSALRVDHSDVDALYMDARRRGAISEMSSSCRRLELFTRFNYSGSYGSYPPKAICRLSKAFPGLRRLIIRKAEDADGPRVHHSYDRLVRVSTGRMQND